ncbi:hypothetical protein [Halorussus pelagicus]|uniref:hypothetical protein n=1 Tax=Halorussus pelagicus TaxID=2505977 RepID=UPI000FFB5E1A|nr:hypothetical protein [Halorussus pelagicus]
MTEEIIEPGTRKQIYSESIDLKNNELWNFKRYYLASTGFKWISNIAEWTTVIFGGVMTYGLTKGQFGPNLLASLSIGLFVVSLGTAIGRPRSKSKSYYNSGQKHQDLFDKVDSFIELDVKREEADIPELRDQLERLEKKRRQLNRDTPQLNGIWYYYLSWRKDKMFEQASTTEKEEKYLS